MFAAATVALEKSAAAINSLNVFPVPDGDTGTNMLLTMQAAMEETYRSPGQSASAVAQAMSWGALMGARGNSGVILSQILRGLAQVLETKDSFTGNDLAAALVEASSLAYQAVSQPVEGTILTVIREAATAAQAMASTNENDVLSILETAVATAKASVARTPTLLPVLRQSGVVDAGGQGLYVVLEGTLRFLRGEAEPLPSTEFSAAIAKPQIIVEEQQYGYCTEFLLQGSDLKLEEIRDRLNKIGESVLVIGDDTTIRAHLHTFDPGTAISYATSLGTLRQVKVENMQDQHQDFITAPKPSLPVGDTSTVIVASGQGLTEVFQSLGATVIVPGGETMNPSVQELLWAVESAPSDKVIVLPNNPNIMLTARQVQAMTQKKVVVVPVETIPQGVTALLAFSYEADFDTNAEAMKQAISEVRTGEITTAVRSMQLDGLAVKEGQAIGFIDGKLSVAGDSVTAVLNELLLKMGMENGTLVTIYYGADTDKDEVEGVIESLRQSFPELEIEVVHGGQPHYQYIVSVE